MKKKHIKITPLKKEDKKLAKIMEAVANSTWDEYGGIIQEIANCQQILLHLYGLKVGEKFFHPIMKEIVKMRMSLIEPSKK